jgi:hypothetical protein
MNAGGNPCSIGWGNPAAFNQQNKAQFPYQQTEW